MLIPIEVTLLGIVIVLSLEQDENALIPIEVTPLRIVTLWSSVHDANVPEPIVVRLPGTVTDVRDEHW